MSVLKTSTTGLANVILLFLIVLALSFCITSIYLYFITLSLLPSFLAAKLIRHTGAATIAAGPSRGEMLCIEKYVYM